MIRLTEEGRLAYLEFVMGENVPKEWPKSAGRMLVKIGRWESGKTGFYSVWNWEQQEALYWLVDNGYVGDRLDGE
jgi:hypothetical protein